MIRAIEKGWPGSAAAAKAAGIPGVDVPAAP